MRGEAEGFIVLLILIGYWLHELWQGERWAIIVAIVLLGLVALAVLCDRLFTSRATKAATQEASSLPPATPASRPPVLKAEDRDGIVAAAGKVAWVYGVVRRVNRGWSGVTWIEFDDGYDGFEAVIFQRARPAFLAQLGDPATVLPGRVVCLSGEIMMYQGRGRSAVRPQIILKQAWALRLVSAAGRERLDTLAKQGAEGECTIEATPDGRQAESETPTTTGWLERAWEGLWWAILLAFAAEIVRILTWLPGKGMTPFPLDIKIGIPLLLLLLAFLGFIGWRQGRAVPYLR